MEASVGLVKKDHGIKLLKKLHQKKLREIERKVSREERHKFIEKVSVQTVEVSGSKKLESSDILRILSEKECPVCGKTVYPPRIYCEECRPHKKRTEENVSVTEVSASLETFEFTTDVNHGIRGQL